MTVLFSDISGSTGLGERLDPEALQRHDVALLRRHAGRHRAPRRHGEKYIGDAIMAVFGLPRTHEDDALRAVRAAVEMRRSLARSTPSCARRGRHAADRTGVNTGEVVATTDRTATARHRRRRQRRGAARAGRAGVTILLGEATYRLVRDAVGREPVEPLELKGKAAAVAAGAYRVVPERAGLGPAGTTRRSSGATPSSTRSTEVFASVVGSGHVRAGHGDR